MGPGVWRNQTVLMLLNSDVESCQLPDKITDDGHACRAEIAAAAAGTSSWIAQDQGHGRDNGQSYGNGGCVI